MAMELIIKAGQVSEHELEADHTLEVLIKTELAILHDKMENSDRARVAMLEGLSMGKRLNLPVNKLGNKDGLREFINRFPKHSRKENFSVSNRFHFEISNYKTTANIGKQSISVGMKSIPGWEINKNR